MRREIKIDLPNQNNVEKQEEKLEDLYINKDLPKIEDGKYMGNNLLY